MLSTSTSIPFQQYSFSSATPKNLPLLRTLSLNSSILVFILSVISWYFKITLIYLQITSSVTVVTNATVAPGIRPDNRELFGMVISVSSANNISSGNNRALFETRMAEFYRTRKPVTGLVIVKVIIASSQLL